MVNIKMDIYFIIFNFFISALAANNTDSYPFINNFDSDKVKNDIQPYNNENTISRSMKLPNCQEPGKCTLLNNTAYCYGIELQYTHTSNSVIHNLTRQQAQFQLYHWKNKLNRAPKCWATAQPFLCALFVPKCENDMVSVPSKTMCEAIQNACKIVINRDSWPFDCSLYKQDKCKNDIKELNFDKTGKCMNPLVNTGNELDYYEDVEGCGLQCLNPLFTDKERITNQQIIFIGSTTAFITNLFSALTFIIDWHSTKKYPTTVSIFFMNVCSIPVSIAYLHQFIPGITQNVICYKDGILKKSEPRFQKDMLCVTNFILIYYFFIAGLVWFTIFAYNWELKLKDIAKSTCLKKKFKGKSYYHLAAWSLSFIFTIMIIAMGEIDGDSLLGVCTVGVENKIYQILFILAPICCSTIGIVLMLKGVFFLLHLKFTSDELIDSKGNSKIIGSVVRVLISCAITFVCNGIIVTYHIYDYLKDQEWKEILKNYIVCMLKSDIKNCEIERRPWTLLVNVYLIALFVSHINTASWIVTSTTLTTWTEFIEKIMNKEKEEPTAYKKHKVIARAYAKRRHFHEEGRISVSLTDSKNDPIGLHLERSSLVSTHSSLSWLKALPRLISRRNALVSNSSHISSSQCSIDLRSCSIGSRRDSTDSMFSIQTFSLKKKTRIKRRHLKKTENFSKINTTEDENAFSSTSEIIDELDYVVVQALDIVKEPSPPSTSTPNRNRRHAIYNIEESYLELLKNSLNQGSFEMNTFNSNDDEYTRTDSANPETY